MTVSTLNPTVGMVATDWFSLNLYKMAYRQLKDNKYSDLDCLILLKLQPEYSTVSSHLSGFNYKHTCLLSKSVNSQGLNPHKPLKQPKPGEVIITLRHACLEYFPGASHLNN